MISSWTLKTFKSVYERTELPIAPLTIFAGVNSSGKSTLLQSILLIAQSLQSPVRRRAITLNGRLLRLGTYADILSTGSDSTSIDIAFTLSGLDAIRINPYAALSNMRLPSWRGATDEVESISCSLTFSSNETSERKEIVQLYPSMEVSRLVVRYRDDPNVESLTESWIETKRSRSTPESQLNHLHLNRVNPDELASLEFSPTLNANNEATSDITGIKTIGTARFHFLPRALLVRYDEVAEQVRLIIQAFTNVSDPAPRRQVSDAMLTALPEAFKEIILQCAIDAVGDPEELDFRRSSIESALASLRLNITPTNLHRLSVSLSVNRRTILNQRLSESALGLESLVSAGTLPSFKTRYQALPSRLGYASEYVGNYFSFNVKYLAPLRDEPKPVYPLSGASDPDDIGFHGEHTAAVLELNKTRDINYVSTASLQDSNTTGHVERATLERAVLDWLVYMGVVTGIYTHDLGKLGHELKVTTAGGSTPRDLTHVGVGVSQVLPIIVLCLMAEPGATLIFEQPELHLHPRVQSRLADFFLSMATLGKQCIVETHSEHLINKLRLRTAQAEGDSVAKLAAMYFVESENERTKYLPIEMNEYGTIKNWPKGFFDEGEKLAAEIIKASIEKRTREKLDK